MKVLAGLTLISLLTLIAAAERSQNNTDEQLEARNAPDVFIYRASAFGPDKHGDSNFTIEIGNTGQNTITAIEWEYYFPHDIDGDDATVTRTFSDRRLNLHPGARIKLTQRVHRYTDKFVTSFGLGTVRIMQVDYYDGSAWRRPAK